MASYTKQEKELKQKLENLEKKYKQDLFKDVSLKDKIESKIKKDVKQDIKQEHEKELQELRKKIDSAKNKEDNSKQIPKDAQLPKSRQHPEIPKKPEIKIKTPNQIQKKAKQNDGRPSEKEMQECAENIKKMKKEIAKAVIGQERIIDGLIMGLLCNAHVLVEGVPGIAKTLAIRALASCSGCSVKRVQFTVDMLPTDIIGITTYTPKKGFEIIKGPIFANFLIADEINRSPPKTQSALIEAMQERQVTIGREKFHLPTPFFVMATENPVENAGVYPLPEAQIDRFLFKLLMDYPKKSEEKYVMGANMTIKKIEK